MPGSANFTYTIAYIRPTHGTIPRCRDTIRGSRGGTGGADPLKNHKAIGFICNTCPDPHINHKATKTAFKVGPPSAGALQRNAISIAFRWRADDGQLLVVFGPHQLKNTHKKKIKVDPL